MPLGGSASRGAVVAVTCPKCGELQTRARKPENEPYECRKCHAKFTRAELERRQKARPPPRKR